MRVYVDIIVESWVVLMCLLERVLVYIQNFGFYWLEVILDQNLNWNFPSFPTQKFSKNFSMVAKN